MEAYHFLVNWFERFPQHKHGDFYIAGESYAAYSQEEQGNSEPFSLVSRDSWWAMLLLMTNNDHVGTFEYWWTHGLISDIMYHKLKVAGDYQSSEHPSVECVRALNVASEEHRNIDPYSVYTRPCNDTSSLNNLKGHCVNRVLERVFEYRNQRVLGYEACTLLSVKLHHPWMSSYDPCTDRYAKVYYNRPEVQRALHANVPGISYPWDTCIDTVGNYWADSWKSLPTYQELSADGKKIWVFSGDTDAAVPVTATRYSINAPNLTILVGVWSQVYKGLTFVTITGAGARGSPPSPSTGYDTHQTFLEEQTQAEMTLS